jgi:adenylate cyclase
MFVSRPLWLRGPWAIPALLAAAALAVLAVLIAGGAELRGPASMVLSPVVSALAVAICVRVAAARNLDRGLRLAWGLFGAAYLANVSGDVLYALLGAAVLPAGYMNLANSVYLLSFPIMLAGLLFVPSAPIRLGERLRFALDLATVFTGSTMVVWTTILEPTVAQHPSDLVALVFAAGPLVSGLVLGSAIAIVTLRGPAATTRSALGFAFASVIAGASADMLYARAVLEQAYVEGQPVDLLWMLGSVLLILGAARQLQPAVAEVAPRRAAAWEQAASLLPYVGMLFGFGMLVRLAVTGGEPQLGVAAGAVLLCALVVARQVLLLAENRRLHERLAREFEKSERLLLNVLPAAIAARLKEHPDQVIADDAPAVTVLFADLVGFTALASRTPPAELLALLNDFFSEFDRLAEQHGLEKIKTIGDAYMAVSGLPTPRADHATAALAMATSMLAAVADLNRKRGLSLQIRVGLHSGPVVAGVIGHHKFCYDLWGDTVNTARRMESHGVPGAVHLSDATRLRLGEQGGLEARRDLEVKGKGVMDTWLLRVSGP